MLGILVFPRATAALVRAHVRPGARVIAVDAGARACLEADVTPDLVVGDMDSVPPDTLGTLEGRGALVERHASEKRDTDGAIALLHARGCDEVLFLGAGGGRADHALANLHLLAQAATRARARAVDGDVRTWIVTREHPLELDLPEGATLSAIPFDARVEGVTYEGLAWPLEEATFEAGDPYGVSNRALAPPQRIGVRSGRLVVMVPTA